jgi:Spy/CpxP family protein refolding chaperone
MKRSNSTVAIVTILCIVLLTLTAAAQPRGPKPMSAAERTEQLKEQLGLTDVQTAKIKALFEAQEKEMRKEFGPPPGGPGGPPPGEPMGEPDGMQTKMMDKQKAFDAKISSILTKEQKLKFDEIQKQLRQRPGPPPGRDDQ